MIMDVDEQLSELMARSVATLDSPPTGPLVAGAISRGRRLRRRRTAAQVCSALAVAGLATGLAVAVVGPGSGDGGGNRAGTIAAVSAPSAPSTEASTPPAEAWTPIPDTPAQERLVLLQTFKSLLPDQRAVTVSMRHGSAEPADAPGYVGLTTTYDDGNGKVQVAVSVSYPPSGGGLGAACQISVCTKTEDGSTLAVYQGSDHPGQPNLEPKNWSVSLERRDGTTVEVTEWNSMTEKTPNSVTRALPPLTIAQLTAIVSSPRWTALVFDH
jgi:hypothetical protein